MCNDIFNALDAQRERSKSRVEQQHADLVKKRWLTVESFTAHKIETLSRIQFAITGSYFLF